MAATFNPLPFDVEAARTARPSQATAVRCHALPARCLAASLGMPCLADGGYEGAGIGILTPVKKASREP